MRSPLALLATAAILLLPTAIAAPEQVHLGIRDAKALEGYTVSWVDTDPAGPSFVTFHGSEGDVKVSAKTIPGPTPGIVYEAKLPKLAPGENASYQIGATTYPLRVPSNGSLSIAAIGDMGVTKEAGDTVKTLQAEKPDLILHAGDISYAGGDPTTWKAWFDLAQPEAATTPWIAALGNHEGDVQGIALDQASVVNPAEQDFFTQRFPIPAAAGTFYYSFDVGIGCDPQIAAEKSDPAGCDGRTHFVALDTFSGLVVPADEAAWLEKDLAAAKDAKWIIAFLHEPPYSSNAMHGSSPRAHDAFAAVLEKHGVDLVITGHDHSYERSFTMKDGKVVSQANQTKKGEGTVYVVTGGAGAELYKTFVDPKPEWSATREAAYEVLMLNITDQRIDAREVATDGSGVHDTWSIARPMSATPPAIVSVPAKTPGIPLVVTLVIAILVARVRRSKV